MAQSKIQWTEFTWNPTTGCDEISVGCKNCYAKTMSFRCKHMGQKKYANDFELTLHEECINEPLSWRKPRTVFVNSMSDLFHEGIPIDFIQRVFHTMNDTERHQYQVLTKRAKRLSEISANLIFTENIWMGVSVENRKSLKRIDYLRTVPANVRFLSIEPLLEDIGEIDLYGIHWVIVGGESGPKARPMRRDWVLNIKRQCDDQNVPFFFKQWGTNKTNDRENGAELKEKKGGRTLLGRTWDAMPYPKGTMIELTKHNN